jgi:hypothetical protein
VDEMESTHQDVPLVALVNWNSTRTALILVATKDAGTTAKGTPYEMKYTDDLGNVKICYVDCPEITSKNFEHSNMIDQRNQVPQSELALEK